MRTDVRRALCPAVGGEGGQHFDRKPAGILPPRGPGQSLPGIYRPGVQRQKHQPPRLRAAAGRRPPGEGGAGDRLQAGPYQPLDSRLCQHDAAVPAAPGGVCLLDRAVRHLHPHRQGDAAHLHRLCPAGAGDHPEAGHRRLLLPLQKGAVHGRAGALRLCTAADDAGWGEDLDVCPGAAGGPAGPADLFALRRPGKFAGRPGALPQRARPQAAARRDVEHGAFKRNAAQPGLCPGGCRGLRLFQGAGGADPQPGRGLYRL